MSKQNQKRLSRRDFNRLTTAALGGALAGTMIGCGDGKPKKKPAPPPPKPDAAAAGDSLLLAEPHVCRGLNTCKGKGQGKKNDCAGKGDCATAKAHTCATTNDCKGQGGCGEKAGQNACNGKGKCNVPLKSDKWQKVRDAFVAAMKEAKKPVGDAPAAKKAG